MSRINIEDGVNFLLGHFQGNNTSWPKRVSAKDNWSISVDCDYEKDGDKYRLLNQASKQMISLFYDAKLQDCRLCPYPDFIDDFGKSARDAWLYGSLGIVPDFIMIDLDKGLFDRILHEYNTPEEALESALYFTLDRINQKFHGEFYPTVLSTGNGYHIYLPVQLSGPSWCLGHTDIFMKLSKTPDRDFLRWAELYLSDGLCDPAHCKTTSFKNMYCRVPGSFNSKNGKPVTILQEWDGQRPYINWILPEFHKYLVDKNSELKPKKQYYGNEFRGFSTKW
jgi:hypothetical protein